MYEENAVDKSASFWSNLAAAPLGILRNIDAYTDVVGSFQARAVISDFESFAWLYGKAHDLPTVSIDNMQVINRCRHPDTVTGNETFDFRLAKLAVKAKMPGAWHYIVSSFFFPPVRKPRTTLVPPILRPQILSAKAEPGEHVLVYQTAASNTELIPTLKRLGRPFRVYGMGREGTEGNVSLRPFSEQGFIDDLRTARAVIAGGGYSLMGEAVHLGVPMLSIPLDSQYEQVLNALWLRELGYGATAPALDEAVILDFLEHADAHREALRQGYTPRDNGMLFGCVDEVLADIEGGRRKEQLDTPAMGGWTGEDV